VPYLPFVDLLGQDLWRAQRWADLYSGHLVDLYLALLVVLD
tara:strand:+ start:1342 stop:1464 length:123 start_codon:yes stop_codon:yes gene_type:complete